MLLDCNRTTSTRMLSWPNQYSVPQNRPNPPRICTAIPKPREERSATTMITYMYNHGPRIGEQIHQNVYQHGRERDNHRGYRHSRDRPNDIEEATRAQVKACKDYDDAKTKYQVSGGSLRRRRSWTRRRHGSVLRNGARGFGDICWAITMTIACW
ncbi:hypothetical protein PMIN07_002496 [Paraphaeosphaeria minitans]